MTLFEPDPPPPPCVTCGREVAGDACRFCGTPNPDTARAARDAGETSSARRVEGLSPGWHDLALDALEGHARRHRTVFVDDVEWPPVPGGGDLRALGAVFGAAVKAGTITLDYHAAADGEVAVLARPSVRSRGGLKPVWRSLVYAGWTS